LISFGIALLLVAASLFLIPTKARGCTCIVVGKNASATGRVLVGHNEDDPGRCVMAHHLVPPVDRPVGTATSFEPCSASIDRSGRSLGYIWSQARSVPALSGADCFLNEKGVFVASDSCRHSRQDNEPDLSDGGLVYGLRISIAERARSARDGVKIAADLIERYGYDNTGRCYIIADAEEAWLLQVIKGKHYCAKRVDDDEVAFIPNHYTIRHVVPGEEGVLLSRGFIEMGEKKGWLTGKDDCFDFARTVQDRSSVNLRGNLYRHRHALSRITGMDWSEEEDLPFSVEPRRPMDIKDVIGVLRDHYEGSSDDVRGKWDSSPHYTEIRRICTGTTLGALVVRFRDRPELNTLWTSSGRPCTSPFVPWYGGVLGMPQEFLVEDHESSLKRHFNFTPKDMAYDPSIPWWEIQQFQSLLDGQFDDNFETVKSHVEEVEKNWIDEDDVIAEKARSLMDKDREEALLILTGETAKKARQSMDVVRYMAGRLPRTEISTDSKRITYKSREEEITLYIKSDARPVEDRLVFGQGMQSPESWATAIRGSLRRRDSDWEVSFRVRELTEKCIPCHSDFWLYGVDDSGSPIVGSIVIDVVEKKTACNKKGSP